MIEDSLKDAGKTPDVKRTAANLATSLHRADALVYKMHGDVSLPDEAVITKDDYETYEDKRNLFSMALQGDVVAKTFMFIGFSFSDPNLSYILARIRRLLGENRRQHYALLRRVQRHDFGNAREYHYAQAKQSLQVDDLGRYGIHGILVDDYGEYTAVVAAIRRKVRMRTVFVAGSAHTYAPWPSTKAESLIQEISRRLATSSFTVVSGFGVGVGPFILNGVLDRLEEEHTRQLDGRIVLRPFPVAIRDVVQRTHRWTEYRKSMLREAGVAIFLFGNRLVDGEVVEADGMVEEFELAASNGIYVIPVGSTESTARILYDRVLNSFDEYFPKRGFRQRFAELGSSRMDPIALAKQVVTLVERLRDAN